MLSTSVLIRMLGKPCEGVGACGLTAEAVQVGEAVCFADQVRRDAPALDGLRYECMGDNQRSVTDDIIHMSLVAIDYC